MNAQVFNEYLERLEAGISAAIDYCKQQDVFNKEILQVLKSTKELLVNADMRISKLEQEVQMFKYSTVNSKNLKIH